MDLKFTFEDGDEALIHYGVEGMKWGVRRYQNKDRTLTAEGKKHAKLLRKTSNAMKTTSQVNDIVKSLNERERELLGAEKDEPWIDPSTEREQSANVAKRVVVSDKKSKEPVSFMEIWDYGGDVGQIAIATKSGDKYRGKGYASESVKKGLEWYNRYGHKNLKSLEWIAENSNTPSINLAKKYGFSEIKMKDAHPEWGDYPNYTILQYKHKGKQIVDSLMK